MLRHDVPPYFVLESGVCYEHPWRIQIFRNIGGTERCKQESEIWIFAHRTGHLKDFNPEARIPFGVSVEHIFKSMVDFVEFLQTVDTELVRKDMARLEDLLMPANFSTLVGEFITSNLPKHCKSIAKNAYHNGHPDLLPAGKYPENSAQHVGSDGIEVRASRYMKSWQGHNPEDVWLMVFVFESGRPSDAGKGRKMARFRFLAVYGALLKKEDWKFDGRSQASRRTITATVLSSGFAKMAENWIYRVPESAKKLSAQFGRVPPGLLTTVQLRLQPFDNMT